ncbi:carbohydrate-binding module family 50 protein [Parathielavia appendiculata]|uniref:Carbohydrate-binding module family 50 protein n=1 Tax=Parathielavia appendiculata TaxID=2587402 RepID=A0AAN6TPU1_9PEZI|nr:carbohydrate-binding module family 50 protein [Parathielavia appendiculata]
MRPFDFAIGCAIFVRGGLSQVFWVEPPTTADPNTIEDCTLWHIAESGDTCPSVSSANFITPEQLAAYNPSLAGSCQFIVGNSYCVEQNWGVPPETQTPTTTTTSAAPTSTGNGIQTPTPIQDGMTKDCNKFHFVVSGDGCTSIQSTYGISFAQLLAWNPAIGGNCQSIWLNTYVCVGVIGGTATTSSPPTTTTTGNGIQTPSPIQEGMTKSCNKFHLVVSGDGCVNIGSQYGVSTAQLVAWNPAIGTNCQTLWLNTYLCVGVIGSTTTSTPSSTTTGNGVVTPTPTREGMTPDCTGFHFVVSGNTCQTISSQYGISFQQFLAWNPYVGSNCAGLWLDTYVCIAAKSRLPTTTTMTTSTTRTGNGIATPTPTQPGMVNNCDTFYKVVSGDGCQSIATRFGISLANFIAWNSGVGQNCQSLWLDTYVCVGLI